MVRGIPASIILAAALLLASCAYTGTAPESADTPSVNEPAGAAMSLRLSTKAGETVRESAAFFCGEIKKNTENGIFIEISEVSVTNGADIGDAAFALVDGADYPLLCKYFKLLGEPFLYTGYNHFTMVLNSGRIMSELKEDMASKGVLPLAVFYTGSDYYLSTTALDSESGFTGDTQYGKTEPDLSTAPILLTRDNEKVKQAAYLAGGVLIQPEPSHAGRANELFEWNAQIAEFSFSEDISGQLKNAWGEWCFTRSFHNAKPLYLIVNAEFYSSLGDRDRAVILEAVSAMYDKIDGEYLRFEEEAIKSLMSGLEAVESDFANARKAFRDKIDSSAERDADENRILSYIYQIKTE